jgi:hypothetical protein
LRIQFIQEYVSLCNNFFLISWSKTFVFLNLSFTKKNQKFPLRIMKKKTHFSILCFLFASFQKSKTIVTILKFYKQMVVLKKFDLFSTVFVFRCFRVGRKQLLYEGLWLKQKRTKILGLTMAFRIFCDIIFFFNTFTPRFMARMDDILAFHRFFPLSFSLFV